MGALANSPFALLDAHSSLRLVTDVVHADNALCLALTCHALRDALGARFPACPRAGGGVVARLAARVTTDGVLDLSHARPQPPRYDDDDWDYFVDESDDDGDDSGGLTTLPEGFGRLAYLPAPGLFNINLRGNQELTTLPAGLCLLVRLEELDLSLCGLRELPEGIGGLSRLRVLYLGCNRGLQALPPGLCALTSLQDLRLNNCGLLALPEGMEGLIGLRTLMLGGNGLLTSLPVGLCALVGLEELSVEHAGLLALPDEMGELIGLRKLVLGGNELLTTLPAGLCALVGLEELYLGGCGLLSLMEGSAGLTGLRRLHLWGNELLTTLPTGLGKLNPYRYVLAKLEELNISDCPGLATLDDMQKREGLPTMLAHLDAGGLR
jgi:hypothetical protein